MRFSFYGEGEWIMTRKAIRMVLLAAAFVLLLSASVSAADYTNKATFRWVKKNGLYYAYDAATGDLIRNCRVGKCYVDENGTRCLNQFVKGVYYNAQGYARKKFTGGWIKVGKEVYYFRNQKRLTGYRKIGGKHYYFSPTGVRLSGFFYVKGHYLFFKKNGVQYKKNGWKTVDGKRYYFQQKGIFEEGFFSIGKKKYYQTILTGIVKGEQTIEGKKYFFDSKGVIDEKKTSQLTNSNALGLPDDILFFTKFESGSVGYAQTGGDNGKACGKYQFDYRYALIPFLKYCYQADPTFFKGFKKFTGYNPGDAKLINNKKLYSAWSKCYNADPDKFSSMQDKYAEAAYYKPAADYLAAKGINLSLRPYVVRGAVFSYAIQEGSLVAAQGVIAAKCKNSLTNKQFLEKLYDYRWKDPRGWGKNKVFYYRYTQEKALALRILKSVEGLSAG